MDDEEIYAGCTRLRLATADWLEALEPPRLDSPSLCSEWTVREVAGHLLAGLLAKPRELLTEVVRQGFRVNRANTALARRYAGQPAERLAAGLRGHADRRLKVPVVGVLGPLLDLLVHGGDMRLPLGMEMPVEPQLTGDAMDYLSSGAPGLVPRTRLRGLRLVATDVDRSWREGAAVEGTLNDLLMATTGRSFVLDRLTGPGVPALAERLA